jgi:hypothetical protein
MILDFALVSFIPANIMVSMLAVVDYELLYGLLLRSQITGIQVTGLLRGHNGFTLAAERAVVSIRTSGLAVVGVKLEDSLSIARSRSRLALLRHNDKIEIEALFHTYHLPPTLRGTVDINQNGKIYPSICVHHPFTYWN